MSEKRRLCLAECTANGGARPREVKLAGGGAARELVSVGKHRGTGCTGAQAEGGYRPNHLAPIRSHRQPAKILPTPYPGFRMVELGYHTLRANIFCCSAG